MMLEQLAKYMDDVKKELDKEAKKNPSKKMSEEEINFYDCCKAQEGCFVKVK